MEMDFKSTVMMRSMLEDSTKMQDKDLVHTTLRMEIDMKDSGQTTNTMARVEKYLQMALLILGYGKKTKETDGEFISLETK